MGQYAIRVHNIGKEYKIGAKQEKYQTLRDTIVQGVSAPINRIKQLVQGQAYGAANLTESIWALQDLNFDVKQGEVVGIIGHNGAGKSTLLKILSQITEPTTGEVRLYGRVGALLEVGTGFHEELTGRENIFLNGAILGMHRDEITRKFDEIVDFSGVEKFVDTPVKHYSSGMKLRLGFAVAAHLEPEILIVDEVLAVGDAAFQKKCIGKMSDVAESGRTVLFVSHNIAAITSLCSRVILLEQGQIVADGDVGTVTSLYASNINESSHEDLASRKDRIGNGKFQFTSIEYQDFETGEPFLQTGRDALFRIRFKSEELQSVQNMNIAIRFHDLFGQVLFTCSTRFHSDVLNIDEDATIECYIPRLPIVSGRYSVRLWGGIGNTTVDAVENAVICDVTNGDYFESGKLPNASKHGTLLVNHQWRVKTPSTTQPTS